MRFPHIWQPGDDTKPLPRYMLDEEIAKLDWTQDNPYLHAGWELCDIPINLWNEFSIYGSLYNTIYVIFYYADLSHGAKVNSIRFNYQSQKVESFEVIASQKIRIKPITDVYFKSYFPVIAQKYKLPSGNYIISRDIHDEAFNVMLAKQVTPEYNGLRHGMNYWLKVPYYDENIILMKWEFLK